MLSIRSIAIIPVILLLLSCTQDTDKSKRSDSLFDKSSQLPPLEILEADYQSASHVALVEVESLSVVDEIRSDAGELGYVVEEAEGRILAVYKGDFGDRVHFRFCNFLEYPTAPRETRLGEQLAFLQLDQVRGRFVVMESGQFPSSDSLNALLNSIAGKH